MTKEEYAAYEQRVRNFFEREGINSLTQADLEREGYFSWRKCECCGGLAGDRWECNGYNPTSKEVQDGYEICTDCLYYVEYGELDDLTMLEMRETNVR